MHTQKSFVELVYRDNAYFYDPLLLFTAQQHQQHNETGTNCIFILTRQNCHSRL